MFLRSDSHVFFNLFSPYETEEVKCRLFGIAFNWVVRGRFLRMTMPLVGQHPSRNWCDNRRPWQRSLATAISAGSEDIFPKYSMCDWRWTMFAEAFTPVMRERIPLPGRVSQSRASTQSFLCDMRSSTACMRRHALRLASAASLSKVVYATNGA